MTADVVTTVNLTFVLVVLACIYLLLLILRHFK